MSCEPMQVLPIVALLQQCISESQQYVLANDAGSQPVGGPCAFCTVLFVQRADVRAQVDEAVQALRDAAATLREERKRLAMKDPTVASQQADTNKYGCNPASE